MLRAVEIWKPELTLPHMPLRRDGDQRAVKTVDDIITVLTHLDEKLKLKYLPRYVADSPDAMPSIRLYDDDLQSLKKVLDKLNDRMDKSEAALVAILKEIRDVGVQVRLPRTSSLQAADWPALSAVTGTAQAERSRSTAVSAAAGGGQVINQSGKSADRSAESIHAAVRRSTDWASIAPPSPVSVANRYAALQSTDDERPDDSQYEEPRSARRNAKRRRQQSQQQQQRSTINSVQKQAQRQGQGRGQVRSANSGPRRAMVGMAPSASSHGLVAANKIVRKAVFCVDNVASNCNADDLRRFVKSLGVHVFTCFPVAPRRRRRDADDDEEQPTSDRVAFRLCIAADDRESLLDASKWPESLLIRPWYRIPPAVAAERRAAATSSVLPSVQPRSATSATDDDETTLKAPTSLDSSSTAGATTQALSMDPGDMDCTVVYYDGDGRVGSS